MPYSFFDAQNGSSDTTLTYTGGAWVSTGSFTNVGVVDSDGNVYTITGLTDLHTPDGTSVSEAKDAGTYVATVQLQGAGTQEVTFSIEKLDLSKAALTIADKVGGYADGDALIAAIKAEGRTPATGIMKVESVDGPGSYGFTAVGEYTATVVSDGDPNVIGTGTVSFAVLDYDVFTDGRYVVKYGRETVTAAGVDIWLEDGEAFDINKVSVVSPDGKTVYSGDQLDIVLSNSKGEKVDASALASAGDYKMTVRVKAFEDFTNGWVGGTSSTFDIDVNGTELDSSVNLGFYLDGEIADEADHLTYDGTDQLGRLTVAVKKGGKTFVEGTDYTVEIKKDGKVVDSAVDAGAYTVTVKPLTFEFETGADTDFVLTIDPMTISGLKSFSYNGEKTPFEVKKNTEYDASLYQNDAVAWTGSGVKVPGVQYKDAKGNYVALDSSVYNVVSIKEFDADTNTAGKIVKEAIEPGTYQVTIALSDEAGSNYALGKERTFTFQVVKYSPFDDVESPAWYASAVADAKFTNLVHGMSGTNMFAPEADITRADAVCIMFNLAGGDNAMADYEYNEVTGWVTGFSDVDGMAYYAKALAWAHNAGVVNGDAGATTFRPTDKITRQELAAMIANYAKATGKYEATDGSALAAMPDASTVSGWATEVVDWADQNGVMGNGGYVAGQDNITRAEVAAMAVNYTETF